MVREYHVGDEEEIVALLRSTFPLWEMMSPKGAVEFWQWKYLHSPLKSYIAVARLGGKIVGVGQTIKWMVKVGDRVLNGYYEDDAATHPDYRNMGIYKALTVFLDDKKRGDGADFCFWVTRNPIVLNKVIIHEQLGFPAPFLDLIRVRDVDKFLEDISEEDDCSHLRSSYLPNDVVLEPIRSDSADCDLKLVDVKSFDESFRDFWREVTSDHDYIMIRDQDNVDWRFMKNPLQEFVIKAIYSPEKLIGYAILNVEDVRGFKEGYIYDLLVARGREDAMNLLLKEVVRHFDSENINAVNMIAIQDHISHKIASSLGFVKTPILKETHVRFWGYNDYFYNTMKTLKPEKIYFNYSDAF